MRSTRRRRMRDDSATQCAKHLADLRRFEKRPEDVVADEPDLHRRISAALASSGATSPAAMFETW